MYETTTKIYLEIADRLLERVGVGDFFAGSVELTDGDVVWRLTCTVVARRARYVEEGSLVRPIETLLPVWWEMTTTCDGVVVENDFSFFKMLLVYDNKE